MLLYCQFLFDHSVFLPEKPGILSHPVTKPEFKKILPRICGIWQTLLLLQFLFNHSKLFIRETKHIEPACNKAGIPKFCPEFEFDKFWIFKNAFFTFYWITLNSFTRETRHIEPPCNKARILQFHLEFVGFNEFRISLKQYSSFSSCRIILNFLPEKPGRETL